MRKNLLTPLALSFATISITSLTLWSFAQEPFQTPHKLSALESEQTQFDRYPRPNERNTPNIHITENSTTALELGPSTESAPTLNGRVLHPMQTNDGNRLGQFFPTRQVRVNGLSEEEQTAANNLIVATEKLNSTNSEEERKAALEELETALAADYDARLSQYEKQLDIMEKKVKNMREKLEKRRAAKSELVKLRMKLIEAEASDLGWPSRLNENASIETRFTVPNGRTYYPNQTGQNFNPPRNIIYPSQTNFLRESSDSRSTLGDGD